MPRHLAADTMLARASAFVDEALGALGHASLDALHEGRVTEDGARRLKRAIELLNGAHAAIRLIRDDTR